MSTDTDSFRGDLVARIADDGRREGRIEGRAEGRAEAIVVLLEVRGLRPGAEVRERVMGCRDLATLDLWLCRATKVADAKDLFGF
jgi:hypothetical protein